MPPRGREDREGVRETMTSAQTPPSSAQTPLPRAQLQRRRRRDPAMQRGARRLPATLPAPRGAAPLLPRCCHGLSAQKQPLADDGPDTSLQPRSPSPNFPAALDSRRPLTFKTLSLPAEQSPSPCKRQTRKPHPDRTQGGPRLSLLCLPRDEQVACPRQPTQP